jgi:hypothetical protein
MKANEKSKRGGRKGIREGTQRILLCALCGYFSVPLRLKVFAKCGFLIILVLVTTSAVVAQTRQRRPAPKPAGQQAAKAPAPKYSAFQHSSDKHKSLTCNACHKLPTTWTAKREFPDVADFPNHNACVRCHRQQFFTRQALVSTGPAVCTVCHVRAAPREDRRFVFGKPNGAGQPTKPNDERQFTIEFPHDQHQNVIASAHPVRDGDKMLRFVRASFFAPATDDPKKPDYNNCSICHQRSDLLVIAPLQPPPDATSQANKFFKTMPRSHDACFDCHWKNQKPVSNDCAGCHKPSPAFVIMPAPERISAMFSHEGGKGEHVMECTTCHINITRAATLRGLTPDVPIAACTTCHKDNKKTTYPKITTIEEQFALFKTSGSCTYCHTEEVGKKKPPASHEAAAQ